MLYAIYLDGKSLGFLRIGFFLSVLFVVLYLVILLCLFGLLILVIKVLFDLHCIVDSVCAVPAIATNCNNKSVNAKRLNGHQRSKHRSHSNPLAAPELEWAK